MKIKKFSDIKIGDILLEGTYDKFGKLFLIVDNHLPKNSRNFRSYSVFCLYDWTKVNLVGCIIYHSIAAFEIQIGRYYKIN